MYLWNFDCIDAFECAPINAWTMGKPVLVFFIVISDSIQGVSAEGNKDYY